MKKNILLALVASAVMGLTASASPKNEILVTTPELTGNYTAVKFGGDFRIVYCAAGEKFRIEAAEGVVHNMEWSVNDNLLTVKYIEGKGAKAIFSGKAPVIYLPADSAINNVELSGNTRFECNVPVKTDSINFDISGTAKLAGDVDVRSLSVYCSGAVNVNLSGSAGSAYIKIDGASNVSAHEEFECGNADLAIKGAAVVKVNCTGKLSGFIEGASVVKYKGDPEVAVRTNGLGSISAIKEK